MLSQQNGEEVQGVYLHVGSGRLIAGGRGGSVAITTLHTSLL